MQVAAWLVRGLSGGLQHQYANNLGTGHDRNLLGVCERHLQLVGATAAKISYDSLTACVGLTVQSHMMMPDVRY
jgi:hypothetical protein